MIRRMNPIAFGILLAGVTCLALVPQTFGREVAAVAVAAVAVAAAAVVAVVAAVRGRPWEWAVDARPSGGMSRPSPSISGPARTSRARVAAAVAAQHLHAIQPALAAQRQQSAFAASQPGSLVLATLDGYQQPAQRTPGSRPGIGRPSISRPSVSPPSVGFRPGISPGISNRPSLGNVDPGFGRPGSGRPRERLHSAQPRR